MSAQIDDGGPAFPVPLLPGETWIGPGSPLGMTLRDWFAGQALNGYLASWETNNAPDFYETDHVAKTAYTYADAMIEARKGGSQ